MPDLNSDHPLAFVAIGMTNDVLAGFIHRQHDIARIGFGKPAERRRFTDGIADQAKPVGLCRDAELENFLAGRIRGAGFRRAKRHSRCMFGRAIVDGEQGYIVSERFTCPTDLFAYLIQDALHAARAGIGNQLFQAIRAKLDAIGDIASVTPSVKTNSWPPFRLSSVSGKPSSSRSAGDIPNGGASASMARKLPSVP